MNTISNSLIQMHVHLHLPVYEIIILEPFGAAPRSFAMETSGRITLEGKRKNISLKGMH